MDPVFLLASERSGTNLMRTRMGNHSKITAPPPIHYFKTFYDVEPYYGSLEYENNLDLLISDMFELNKVSIEPWECEFRLEDVKRKLKQRSFTDVFQVFFDLITHQEGKEIWFCKENLLFEYSWKILDHFNSPKFIYLVRDPRDVFVSFKKRASGEKTAYAFAEMWKKENNKCIRLLNELAFKDKILSIRYEDILQSPESTYNKICEFVGVEFEKDMLKGQRKKANTMEWENLSKGIIRNNSQKYKNKLKPSEIKIIEKIAFNEMKILGYEIVYEENNFNISMLNKLIYSQEELIKRVISFIYRKKIKGLFDQDRKTEYKVRKKRLNLINKINRRGINYKNGSYRR